MNDQDLETLLRRYRPIGPPSALRARCIERGASEGVKHAWPWAAAAAALLVATIGLTTRTARLEAPVAGEPDQTARAIEDLAALLGADDVARSTAALIVAEEEARRAARAAIEPPPPIEGIQ
jgi:hypothetical protein